MGHNLDLLSFQKNCGSLGFTRKMKALQRSACGRSRRVVGDERKGVRTSENTRERLGSSLLFLSLVSFFARPLELPYYANIEMCIVDPLHNLFLGTAKRVFTKWIVDDVITKEGLQIIEARIDEISSLSDFFRLPGNIKSNYAG